VPETINDWIARWSTNEDVAFRFEGDVVTYADFARRIVDAAAGLVADGVGAGDRVGFCGLNRVEVFELLFGCAHIGAIFVPFNNRLTPSELQVLVDDADPTALYVTDGYHDLIAEAAPQHSVRDLDHTPFEAARAEINLAAPSVDTIALMIYTSGTTGQSKGAMLSHEAMAYSVLNAVEYQNLTADDFIVAGLPIFHVGGLNVQTIPALYAGAEIALMRRFDPAEVLALVAEYEVTQMVLVPAMLNAVAAQPAFATTDFSEVRGVISGSSIVPSAAMQPFFDQGVPVGQMYGLTETGPTAIVLRYDEAADHIGSCGRPAAHTELRIVDLHGADVAQGDAGELWLRGPHLFTGYWRNEQATAEAFAEAGWFRTGDVGFADPDGYVYVNDRIKDVVITGGENVYPAEIEPVLAQHPAIAAVSVIGAPDEQWGEIPVAVVELHPGEQLEIDELRAWCDGRMARFKQPRMLRVVEQLPRTALGKVMKHHLRDSSN